MLALKLKGLDALVQRIERLEAGLQEQALGAALYTGALIVEADAKVRVPKVTGTLARSIHTEVRGATAVVGTNVVYARRIEYGFVGLDSLGRRYNQPPQPYLRPALATNRDAVLATVAAELRSQLARLGA